MEKEDHKTRPSDLPTQRFYFTFNFLISGMSNNERGNRLFSDLYPIIYSYYLDSLALLRATTKLFRIVGEEEQHLEEHYLSVRSKLDKQRDPEDDEIFNIYSSRLLEQQIMNCEDLDLEKNLFSLGTIVQFLSLTESTLHSIYKEITKIDTALENIELICKRDKGIIKYLKYFEKVLISNPNPVIVGTSEFQKIHLWIQFRNNIVHNNNETKEELLLLIKQNKLPISVKRHNFIFDNNNIRELADICGNTINILIDEILRPYFINTNALIE